MESFLAPELVPRELVEEHLIRLAKTNPEQFKIHFRHLRRPYPRESVRMCIRYISEYGADPCTKSQLLPWVTMKNYFELLIDPDFLPIDLARCAAETFRVEDPQFFMNFSRLAADEGEKRAFVARALALLEGLTDYTILFSWLRDLTTHPDERTQSQAVKAFCKLRSNTALISRQLKAEDGRVRANAIEALWPVRTPEAAAIFRAALEDTHHRVVINALIGLHYQHDRAAFEKLLEYAAHSSELYRTAAIWGLGHLAEVSAIPVLRAVVSSDPSNLVREKAAKVLAALSEIQSAAVAA